MNKKNLLIFLIIIIPGCLLYLVNLNGFPVYFWDEETYLMKSIYYIDFNFDQILYTLGHPPLAQFFLSLSQIISINYGGLRFSSSLFTVFSGYIVYLITRFYTTEKWGILSAYFFYINGLVLIFGRMALLDTCLMFFLLLKFRIKNFIKECFHNPQAQRAWIIVATGFNPWFEIWLIISPAG